MVTKGKVTARAPREVLASNPYCEPLRQMYRRAEVSGPTSWKQIEADFLTAMSIFDAGLPQSFRGSDEDNKEQSSQLSAALQNGKGDWFNNLVALLLERCSGIQTLYVRRKVPGLIIAEHNLDGVYPGDPDREIAFLLEAKMMGTPKHANSPGQKAHGRAGSADTNKRVKELAFKSIDLKGEASRRLSHLGVSPQGGPGGGDLSTWLHETLPRIYFFMAVRVVSDKDFVAVLRWAETAAQVVDAVGLYCYGFEPGRYTTYHAKPGIPTVYELDRVLFRTCQDLRKLAVGPPVPIKKDVAPTPATLAAQLTMNDDEEPVE